MKIEGDRLEMTYTGDVWAGAAWLAWAVLNLIVLWQLVGWIADGGSILISLVAFAIIGVGLWLSWSSLNGCAIIRFYCDRAQDRVFVRRTGLGWTDHLEGPLSDIAKISFLSADHNEYWLMVEMEGGAQFPIKYARKRAGVVKAAKGLKAFLDGHAPTVRFSWDVE